MTPSDHPPYDWWASLKHGGLLIAPSRLPEFFPAEINPLPADIEDRLRRDVIRLETGRPEDRKDLLDTVLERVLRLGRPAKNGAGRWLKGRDVPTEWTHRAITGEAIKPRRVWQGPHGVALPVFFDEATRLGIGRGRRQAARIVEWLRKADRPIALLTNAHQWRLIYAGIDFDAFAEWDLDLWFEEGRAGSQVTALRTLLSPEALIPDEVGKPGPLLAAIDASRRGQAELSSVLGERVRLAVETLIKEHGPQLTALDPGVEPRHIYLAATRVIMRMIVILFAEARDLLPRDNPIYHESYGLQGLREALDRVGGGSSAERLRHRWGAWPRVLALFRLVYDGSPHPAMPIPRYGGGLFHLGDPDSKEPEARALGVFEDREHAPSDQAVHRVLELLTRSDVKVRQGRVATWVEAPVDFSDLSTEYIGILYEGLLDYELRRVEEGDPVIFLNLGDQPALPLSRLEVLDDAAVARLVESFKNRSQLTVLGDDEDEEDTDEEGDEDVDMEEESGESKQEQEGRGDEPLSADEKETTDDAREIARARAREWARRAVVAGKMVRKAHSKAAAAQRHYETQIERAADALVARVVLPGEWYLVRYGGTRKGSGTFYTPRDLAAPTVRRTLLPLTYELPSNEQGEPDEVAPRFAWKPRTPEEILALKVCDPACGSGSFPVAALRFLTDALAESLYAHGRIQERGNETLVTLAEGIPGGERLDDETLPCRSDDEAFDGRLRARLKRHVVERCIYGVDVDSLAVELCRLALWIETMDRTLPFSFLDHKIKLGNSLIGCWFDRFRFYPALAWEREGGDKSHNGVHFDKNAWTKAIKNVRSTTVKAQLREVITEQIPLFERIDGRRPEELHDEALDILEEIHRLPAHETEERAAFYRDRILGNPALARLREAFDTWCAVWLWSADRLDSVPLPHGFAEPSEETRRIVSLLVREHRFFHWELEFPDVFAAKEDGFHALVGNPPWDIQKPNSKEFFSNLDPLYRTYGKQEALRRQKELFERSPEDEREWIRYNARFRALSNLVKQVGSPFGDGAQGGDKFHLGARSSDLHLDWATLRKKSSGYTDPAHPFRYQGSADINSYKLFLEQSYRLLKKGGRLGMITPSGLYTDKGTTALRKLFLDQNRWHWLFGFENRDGIFDIHRSFKFGPTIVQKDGRTTAIRTAFMHRDLAEWVDAERHVIPYEREQVKRFSPKTFAILEIRNRRDLEILEKIYANSVLLGDDSDEGWRIQYAREFDMTNDSKLFPPRPKWESDGYRPDEYSRWLKGTWRKRELGGPADPERPRWEIEPGIILSQDGYAWIHEDDIEDVALPLYQGVMIYDLCPNAAAYVGGSGHKAKWMGTSTVNDPLLSQFLMGQSTYRGTVGNRVEAKLVFRSLARATDMRTSVPCLVGDLPCGNSLGILTPAEESFHSKAFGTGIMGSLVYDWALRQRIAGTNINSFFLFETGWPRPKLEVQQMIARIVMSLTIPYNQYSPLWLKLTHSNWNSRLSDTPWRQLWALSDHERLRTRAMLEAVIAKLHGLEYDDLLSILEGCDHPKANLTDSEFTRTLDPKGFWRIDKDRDPELRLPVLAMAAFVELQDWIANCGNQDAGFQAFLESNGGEGWTLPETVSIADLGLGHDARARNPQPVHEPLGPRLYDSQLEQSAKDSWEECELHVRNLCGELEFANLRKRLGTNDGISERVGKVAEGPHGTTSVSFGSGITGESESAGERTQQDLGLG